MVPHLVMKFCTIYGVRKFITVFTTASTVLILSQTNTLHSHKPSCFLCISILSFYLRLRLSSGPLPSEFPIKTLHAFLFSIMRAISKVNLALNLNTIIIFGGEMSTNYESPHNAILFSYFLPLRSKYFPQHPILEHPQPFNVTPTI
jgi:hypothetical protein